LTVGANRFALVIVDKTGCFKKGKRNFGRDRAHATEVDGNIRSSEPSALRYVSYAAAVAALVGGLAWAAEQAAAAPTAPEPQTLTQVQPLRAAVMELPGLAIAPPEVA